MDDPSMSTDPETAFLASKQVTGNEWELYKENVRPLKRGRNVQLLNQALRAQHDRGLKKSLLQTRRGMIQAIEEYKGEDPLQPWLDCIKWVQESFPSGGECSGLIVIYEQCVRAFWHDDRYKDDLRYLKVWMEYAENCADAEVIYSFLEANQIGQSHSIYYSSYALHMESKNKLRKADEIFNLGISRKAKPLEKLEAVYRTFLVRITKKQGAVDDEQPNNPLPVRSFGTVLTTGEARRQPAENSDLTKRRTKLQRLDSNRPLSIYNDANSGASHHCNNDERKENSWHILGTRSDRNKENTSVPAKWVSYKIPQKVSTRTGLATSSTRIEVYIDEERADSPSMDVAKSCKPSVLKLRKATSQNLKKETELLKEDPLRNFPLNSLR
ncbi:mitotic spindle checkpoint protein BUBR1 [Phoenix dactylifera]|uniref:Mitotic spindle checkpoint protein BUBR1 n=1 Tax=Phoenix dactylifera TaxID=42345 RepID=A0A8B7D2H2_PHODC|nr:mitotic spindle checkpoint protein BUBR1 [Phoenix dactylifera]